MDFGLRNIRLFLVSLLLLIPLNLYRIGKDLGAGIQWALFRVQVTDYGTMVFTIVRELNYVYSGTIAGKSALSLTLWFLGALSLLTIIALLLLKQDIGVTNFLVSILLYVSGLFFLASCIFQYGVTLAGPAGYCIPLGVLVIWVVGLLIHLGYFDEDEGEMADDDEGEDEDKDKDEDEDEDD